jgi:hypothetical protein
VTDHPEIQRIVKGLAELHKLWTPHAAQIKIGSPLISGEVTEVFAQCGRNLGKTELVSYLLWRMAWTYSGSENYFFAPYMKQAREILWSSKRVQTFGPSDWIADVNNTEMRITFTNGSFIKLDGSDNVEAYRGVKPRGLTVYDEFKDFRPEFHDAYDPNRAAHNSPLIIIGTPDEFDDSQFSRMADQFARDSRKAFFQIPTSENPYISKDWLEKKKAELYALGEAEKWEREYEAKRVRGGAKSIFPMLGQSHVRPHAELMARIWKDRKKLEWILWADPASASCFAGLFAAHNPYSKELYLLNEIYELSEAEMTVGRIWPRFTAIRDDLYSDGEWRQGYDEASAWFASEVFDQFSEGLEPTQKMKSDKVTGLSLIKDALLQKKLWISDRCPKLFWEMERYRKDDSGKIPKKNDHLIDCLRYTVDALNYSTKQVHEPQLDPVDQKTRFKFKNDFPDLFDHYSENW